MKKTIHINLAGMAFHIEEDAFAKLEQYLKDVEVALGSDPGKKETLDDIEARVAELFLPLTGENVRAVNIKNVEDVIKVLGAPEDYKITDDDEPKAQTFGRTSGFIQQPTPKRLYRDTHNRVFGGVCSGLGVYFNTDPVYFRLFFIVIVLFNLFLGLFFWLSLLPYIVLWIAMPKAYSIEQRMQMYGGDPLLSKGKPAYKPSGANTVLRVLGAIFGVLLMMISFVVLTTIGVLIFPVTDFPGIFPGGEWISGLPLLFFPDAPWYLMLGLFLFIGIPFILIFYLGLHLVFRFKRGGKFIGVIGIILWFASIAMLSIGGGWIAQNFRAYETIKEEFLLDDFNGETLHLKLAQISTVSRSRDVIRFKGFLFQFEQNETIIEGRANIHVKRDAPQFSIVIERDAKGRDKFDAFENASNIDLNWHQNDSILELSRVFSISGKPKLRNQKVRITVMVPEGKEVDIDRRLNVRR